MVIKKKVLVIENEDGVRLALRVILEASGFEVFDAKDEAEACRLAEQHWEELDVVIVDMHLIGDEDDETQLTGAEIVIRFRQKELSFPPESVVYSRQSKITYYRLAMRLGAAAYVLKGEQDSRAVVQHVRVLALRRALNGENPKTAAEVARIAVHSSTQSDAILTFCHRVLQPEFEACLGVQFVILVTEGNTTRVGADNIGLPPGSSSFYHTLQALAHGKGNLTEPFVLESENLEPPTDQETAQLYKQLNRAAFLPLSLSNKLRLSIGILHSENNEPIFGRPYEEALCVLLAQYLRPTVLQSVMNIWSVWTELRATRTSTAKLCLSVGQEINVGLAADDLDQLEDLANDLNDTGQYLTQLENRSWRDDSTAISVKDLVEATSEYVCKSTGSAELKPQVQGDCSIQARRSDLEIIFSRLLQWFVYRSKTVPLDVSPAIKIECDARNGVSNISFEDTSHRLPKKLREDMFAPFTQAISTPFAAIDNTSPITGADADGQNHTSSGRYLPLYLAKMLVEGRYHGLLEDHSDEITGHAYGHRILMQFPTVSSTGEI